MPEAKNSDDPRAEAMELQHKVGELLLLASKRILDWNEKHDETPTQDGRLKLEYARKFAETGASIQLASYEHWDEYQRGKGSVPVEDQMDVAALLAESRHSGAIPEGATLTEAIEAVLGAYDAEVEGLIGDLETTREQ
jgi:hypothetical protein